MWGLGNCRRRLLALTIVVAAMLVVGGVLSLRGDVAYGNRLDQASNYNAPEFDQDPKIYLPLVMKRYCTGGWEDDFSDPTSGWWVDDEWWGKFEYLNGEYHVWIKEPGWGAYIDTWPYLYATNFTLEVDGRSESGIYGLVFGKRVEVDWDEDVIIIEWYSFEVGPGNYWAIYKAEPLMQILDSGYSSYITSGMNKLKIIRDGSLIEVYVNGNLISTLTDSSFLGSRNVGLVALAPETATAHIYFDNFRVCPVDSGPGVGAAGAPGIREGIILRRGTPPTIEFWPR